MTRTPDLHLKMTSAWVLGDKAKKIDEELTSKTSITRALELCSKYDIEVFLNDERGHVRYHVNRVGWKPV